MSAASLPFPDVDALRAEWADFLEVSTQGLKALAAGTGDALANAVAIVEPALIGAVTMAALDVWNLARQGVPPSEAPEAWAVLAALHRLWRRFLGMNNDQPTTAEGTTYVRRWGLDAPTLDTFRDQMTAKALGEAA